MYRPLHNEFITMLHALYSEGVEPSEAQRQMLLMAFMSGAMAFSIVADEGKLQLANDELEDFKTEIERRQQ